MLKQNTLFEKSRFHPCLLVFSAVTAVFTVSRFVLFQGFHGTDDLHYAMLAANMLKGKYDPFQPGDIFSGRIILVAWQALLYSIGGINVFMTSVGTVAATVAACLITVTKLLPVRTPAATLVACCLFYFSPPVANDITGISPDPYILLVSTCILLLLKIGLQEKASPRKSLLRAVLMGVLIAITLLVKETIIIFLPYSMLIIWLYHKQKLNSLWIFISCVGTVALMGYGYHHFAGNAFFKLSQVENSAYPNPCNFSYLPLKDLLIRLTYGTWQAFILSGFYPFVLGGIALLVSFSSRKDFYGKREYDLTGFGLLLLLGLYFPFSWKGYQPLCAVARHFYFLLPSAVILVTATLRRLADTRRSWLMFTVLSLFLLMVCLSGTSNKWQWMIYIMLFTYFSALPVLKRLAGNYQYAALSCILFISILEPLFFNRTEWFKNMHYFSKTLDDRYYYFPDHDNLMHWKLLHCFDERTVHAYNIEKQPYKVYRVYYEEQDSMQFHPGWLMVNKVYTTCSPVFLNKVDSLRRTGYFSRYVVRGELGGFWMDRKEQYEYIRSVNFRK